MNNKDLAKAIETKRNENLVKYCWIEPGDDEAEKVAQMQKEYPLHEVVPVGWQRY